MKNGNTYQTERDDSRITIEECICFNLFLKNLAQVDFCLRKGLTCAGKIMTPSEVST